MHATFTLAKIIVSRTNKKYTSIPFLDKLCMNISDLTVLKKKLAIVDWTQTSTEQSPISFSCHHCPTTVVVWARKKSVTWSLPVVVVIWEGRSYVLNCWVQKTAQVGSLLHWTGSLQISSFPGLNDSCCDTFQWNTVMVATQMIDYFSSRVRYLGGTRQI